jgi:hypothetical protein
MKTIKERKAKRLQFLRGVYERANGGTVKWIDCWEVGDELGITHEEADAFALFWWEEGYCWEGSHEVAMRPRGITFIENMEVQEPEDARSPGKFLTPPGNTWPDVHINMTDFNITIQINDRTMQHSYQDVGFEDRRRNKIPNTQWELLKLFAVRGGVVARDAGLGTIEHNVLKNRVSQLRRSIKALMPRIEGEPISYDWSGRCYRTMFKIRHLEQLEIPTPAGTTWTCVSIIETENGTIRISFPKTETILASTYTDVSGQSVCKPEAAQQEDMVVREYDLRTLGLENEKGVPTVTGKMLLSLLQRGGRIQATESDKAMLRLNEYLNRLLNLEDSPFDFSEENRDWIARFEASSESGITR